MIRITDSITVPDSAVAERFVRATGDRGQNSTRDATAVELRFHIGRSSLPGDMQARLIGLGGRHVTKAGVLMVVSRASGSQAENRKSAHARLLALLKRAAVAPRIRRATRRPALSAEERLQAKHLRAARKRSRATRRDVDPPFAAEDLPGEKARS
jgi:ribosome-associated protein